MPKLPEKPKADAVLTPPPPQPKAGEAAAARGEDGRKEEADRSEQAARTADDSAPDVPDPTCRYGSRAVRERTQTPSMSPATWQGALMAHLNRYKRFPHGAAGTGVVTVAFSIDRSGRVLSSRLVRSSGDPVLDADAVSLPRRASPVPAPPPNIGGGVVTLTIPFRYSR